MLEENEFVYNTSTLKEKAEIVRLWMHNDDNPQRIEKTFKIYKEIIDPNFNFGNLEFLLQTCRTTEKPISKKNLKKYNLIGLIPDKYKYDGSERQFGYEQSNKQYDIYLDGPFGFCLMFANKPNATIGFDFINENIFSINQLQAIRPVIDCINDEKMIHKGGARGLFRIDWEKLMILNASLYAAEKEFPIIKMVGAINLRWINETYKDGTPHMILEDAIKRYDNNAKRLGFKLNNDGNWYIQTSEFLKKHLTGKSL